MTCGNECTCARSGEGAGGGGAAHLLAVDSLYAHGGGARGVDDYVDLVRRGRWLEAGQRRERYGELDQGRGELSSCEQSEAIVGQHGPSEGAWGEGPSEAINGKMATGGVQSRA